MGNVLKLVKLEFDSDSFEYTREVAEMANAWFGGDLLPKTRADA